MDPWLYQWICIQRNKIGQLHLNAIIMGIPMSEWLGSFSSKLTCQYIPGGTFLCTPDTWDRRGYQYHRLHQTSHCHSNQDFDNHILSCLLIQEKKDNKFTFFKWNGFPSFVRKLNVHMISHLNIYIYRHLKPFASFSCLNSCAVNMSFFYWDLHENLLRCMTHRTVVSLLGRDCRKWSQGEN